MRATLTYPHEIRRSLWQDTSEGLRVGDLRQVSLAGAGCSADVGLLDDNRYKFHDDVRQEEECDRMAHDEGTRFRSVLHEGMCLGRIRQERVNSDEHRQGG